MASERLTGSEKRALFFWVLLGIVGAMFAQRYYFRAFPEAAVDLQVTRGEALKRAQQFVGGLGEDLSGYQSAIIFDVDDDAKTYLERELGLEQANRLMSSELSIWYWDVRFFKPQQEEEFRVRVSPAGRITGYDHKIEEARRGATLDRTTAEQQARDFLTGKIGIDLSKWDFLPEEANSNKRPNRTDWTFTWEKHGFRAKDAPYRLETTLQGNRIGGTEQFLQVPEAWTRSFERLRSSNDSLTLVFTVPYLMLLAAAVWLAIRLTKEGATSWRMAIVLGIGVTALLFLQNLNDWPHWNASYDTNDSYGSFLLLKIASALLISALTALTITLVLPAAEPLYRASQPEKLRLAEAVTLRGLRSKEFFCAAVVGLSLAAAHIGYVVLFYIVARRFGAWAPQDLNFDNSVNTLFPWISGAAIGLLASTNEEFTFRLFAIPFFQRFARWRWIAVIVPAFLWSFLHSNYPQEPPYIRGIEIGLVGIVAGLVMLRWGILATLIWHYTVDASLVGLLLIRSNSLYFKVSGAVVAAAAAAPLAFAGISYLLRGRFEPDEDLLNKAAPAPEISLAPAGAVVSDDFAGRQYEALAPGTIGFLAICLVAGGLVLWRVKPEAIGDYLKLEVDAREATSRGDEVLRQRGQAANSYDHATLLVNTTDPVTNEFLRQRLGVARVNEIYATQVPGALWHVRYFRDSQPEEYAVVLKPDGAVHSIHHQLAEETPGASLTKDEAVALAEKYLREEKKIELGQWSLVEANSEKRPHRTDHVLTWQQNTPLDAGASSAAQGEGNAYARITLAVLGDEVADYRIFIKIPDDWRRKQEELTIGRVLINFGLRWGFLAAMALWALIALLLNLRSEEARGIPWKRLAFWALWGLAAYVLVFAFGDRIATLLNAYQTAIPFKTMIGLTAITITLGAFFYYGVLALLFGSGWYYATHAFGRERLVSWLGMPAPYYRDALWIGLGGAAGLLALQTLLQTALKFWPTAHRATEASIGSDYDAILPAGSILGSSILHGLIFTGLLVLAAAFVSAEMRQRWLRFVAFALGALALTGSSWGTPADLAKQWLAQAVFLGVVVFAVRRMMRFNVLGCFLALAGMALLGGATELLGQPNRFYQLNGAGVMIALLLLVVWPLAAWRMGSVNAAGNRQV